MPVINKELFRRIEHELYTYPQHVRELNERRAEALYGTPQRREGRSKGRVSDPTAARGDRLARLSESEQAKWVECIHEALKLMPMEYKMLVKYRYFDKHKTDDVADKIHISRALYFVWREYVILYIAMLATQKGLVQPFEQTGS